MRFSGYELLWLFFVYSFVGWVIETAWVMIHKKHFVNRGIINGPLCVVYGFGMVILSVVFWELQNSWFFLFIGCAMVATFLEWLTGHFLEHITHRRWWDYSGLKWNLEGYISLWFSVLWGILAVIGLKYTNGMFLKVFNWLPTVAGRILVLALLTVLIIDCIGTFAAIFHIKKQMPNVESFNGKILNTTHKIESWIFKMVEQRVKHAYPSFAEKEIVKEKTGVFAEGCGFEKLFCLFVIGAFLGDVVEIIFCRFSMGRWMSRTSLVWGQFSVVWGIAIVLATAFLYRSKEKPSLVIFTLGTLLGGVYEYVCSVFTEIVFGKVFWDYSKIPLNLGGRINLVFCFFWGFAAVVWIKFLYPRLSNLIEKIPPKVGKPVVWIMVIFMLCNIIVSVFALIRYDTRGQGKEAESYWEQVADTCYGDDIMEQIYPNAIKR